MLTGTFQRTLDSKSRITLPSTYRKDFSSQVCLVPFGGALYGFTPEGFDAWVTSQFERGDKHYDSRDLNDVRLMRIITASATPMDLDAAGRVSLSKVGAKKLQRYGIEKNVTVLGTGDHFEVWSTEKWEAENEVLEDDLFDLMFNSK